MGKNPETALSPRSKRFEEHKKVLAEAKEDLEEELSKAEAEGKPQEELLRLKSAIATPFKSLYDLEDVPMEPDSEPEAEVDRGHRRSQIEKLIERAKHFMVPPKLSGSLPRSPSASPSGVFADAASPRVSPRSPSTHSHPRPPPEPAATPAADQPVTAVVAEDESPVWADSPRSSNADGSEEDDVVVVEEVLTWFFFSRPSPPPPPPRPPLPTLSPEE